MGVLFSWSCWSIYRQRTKCRIGRAISIGNWGEAGKMKFIDKRIQDDQNGKIFACGFCYTVIFHGNFPYFLSTEINPFHWKTSLLWFPLQLALILLPTEMNKTDEKKSNISSEKIEKSIIRLRVHQIFTFYLKWWNCRFYTDMRLL